MSSLDGRRAALVLSVKRGERGRLRGSFLSIILRDYDISLDDDGSMSYYLGEY